MVHLFCSWKPQNQLTSVITKIGAVHTNEIIRFNGMLREQSACGSGREEARAVVIKQSECYTKL